MKHTSETALNRAQAPGLTGGLLRICAGVALLTLSAKVQVPFWPVPMTLQVAAVMAILAAGAMGLPVFAGTPEKGLGLAYMLGGTGGYLVGFVLAAALVGAAAERLPKIALWPAMLGGLAVIYALGLAWLAQFVPQDALLAYGVTPFILGDLVKITLAAVAIWSLPTRWLGTLRGASDA